MHHTGLYSRLCERTAARHGTKPVLSWKAVILSSFLPPRSQTLHCGRGHCRRSRRTIRSCWSIARLTILGSNLRFMTKPVSYWELLTKQKPEDFWPGVRHLDLKNDDFLGHVFLHRELLGLGKNVERRQKGKTFSAHGAGASFLPRAPSTRVDRGGSPGPDLAPNARQHDGKWHPGYHLAIANPESLPQRRAASKLLWPCVPVDIHTRFVFTTGYFAHG